MIPMGMGQTEKYFIGGIVLLGDLITYGADAGARIENDMTAVRRLYFDTGSVPAEVGLVRIIGRDGSSNSAKSYNMLFCAHLPGIILIIRGAGLLRYAEVRHPNACSR